MNSHSVGSKNPIQQLENLLTIYLVKKAPYTIPTKVREKIVSIAPWIDLILIITFLPILVVLCGLNFIAFNSFMPMGSYYMYGGGWGLTTIIACGSFILEIIAIPGLFKRKKYAWTLFMCSALLIIIKDLIFFSVGGILGGIIGLYILFQIKEYYT